VPSQKTERSPEGWGASISELTSRPVVFYGDDLVPGGRIILRAGGE